MSLFRRVEGARHRLTRASQGLHERCTSYWGEAIASDAAKDPRDDATEVETSMIAGQGPLLPGEKHFKVPVSPVPFGVSDLFKVGIGPSSSHTVGPMKAGACFRGRLLMDGITPTRIRATAHGSLAWTGKGHATDVAIVLGLLGERPDDLDADTVAVKIAAVAHDRVLTLGTARIAFDPSADVVFDFEASTFRHPNAMTFEAFVGDDVVAHDVFFSVGGGFIERDGDAPETGETLNSVRFAYSSGAELLALARAHDLTLAAVVRANEETRGPDEDLAARLDRIEAVMLGCIESGLGHRGILPGGLRVRRRAADMHARLLADREAGRRRPNEAMDFVSCFAMAVNEENAAGGRVVTAPTNGASGVIPAVLRYYRDFCDGTRDGAHDLLLTATAVGDLIKRRASISGAEVGCQGEVGSAAAMAAAGLCAAFGGDPAQVLNAAEIGLEHHLGMTCDPIGGLVQIPCIERNAFGAIKAISAASLALHGDGAHVVSLDQVIETMRQTGLDMMADYRETSRGGLAVNVPEC